MKLRRARRDAVLSSALAVIARSASEGDGMIYKHLNGLTAAVGGTMAEIRRQPASGPQQRDAATASRRRKEAWQGDLCLVQCTGSAR